MPINRDKRLASEHFVPTPAPKSLIVVHHTVGGSVASTIAYWESDPRRIATAYLIERDGEIFEVFDPHCWAYHIGRGPGINEQRSIGIELANEGGLIQRDGVLYCFDRVSERTRFADPAYDHGLPWRGYRFFAAYPSAQLVSLASLINELCADIGIPRRTPADHLQASDSYRDFSGILGHHHLRRDKSDTHPGLPWQQLVDACQLELVPA